ncbi:HDIG domain-containing metalloprotein [Nitratidesulfovibrio liaohensis]|uniref:HDIG domain-containing protein n=1 Tax=Nitratidesulfovibrio liaohensis TaxID=2604158 RepID=A0ABY9R2Z8_9BACT|nr:HDIG domain-containing metalloprotein [Nitratidesulfovibrio liaohensis]WMW66146.1 HDIG domain-containing protein [Nitratidesulfovibrio liaohensis]
MNATKPQTPARHKALSAESVAAPFRWLARHQAGPGLFFFCLTMIALAVLAGANLSPSVRLYVAGEIASQEVTADRDLLVEDVQGTRARREQVAQLQPAVFDLSREPVTALRQRVHEIFLAVNHADPAEQEQLRWQLAEALGTEITERTISVLASEELQTLVTTRALPWLESRLTEGVSADTRIVLQFKGGVLLRDLATGSETLRSDLQNLHDLRSVVSELSQNLKNETKASLAVRRTAVLLLSPLLSPTLTLNREATDARVAEMTAAVEPVFYRIQKGEVVVRQGERVSREHQLKLQALWARKGEKVHLATVAGVLLTSLLLGAGMLFSPSGRMGSAVRQKDLFFVALLLLVFALMSKGLTLLGQRVLEQGASLTPEVLSFAFPVAGAAGLAALIFSARRYCVTGLLLAFFCTVLAGGGLPLFMFYFLGAMWNTWLVTRAQTRQDVVWSTLPLCAGQLLIWLGATALGGHVDPASMAWGVLAVAVNAMLSLLLLFALSPIIELCLGYTTRFRLMELMNLEQPLLQDLMVAVPGTYHHSLIVSNMVEAGAKAIGANSLLCKVAALYHDIGKLSRPEYFIENQFGGRNKHDKLAPSMSALILTSHVKKGVELAQQHRLGQEIVDIIGQHHGTRVIRYFYQKAVNQGENPREQDYQYPGPRPQTREAAIVMLADAVEASSRTLVEPTPARIKGHIDTIVKGIFAEGQLDESELTFKDLHKLGENFHRILTGLFHQRIGYPDAAKPGQPDRSPDRDAPKCGEKGAEKCPEKNGDRTGDKNGKTGEKNGGNGDIPCPACPPPCPDTATTGPCPACDEPQPPMPCCYGTLDGGNGDGPVKTDAPVNAPAGTLANARASTPANAQEPASPEAGAKPSKPV